MFMEDASTFMSVKRQQLNIKFKVSCSLKCFELILTITGWKISLVSKFHDEPIVWDMFTGYHGLEYPTYSPSLTHEIYSLNPDTETFITFRKERDIILSKRGDFQSEIYCKDYEYHDAISCYKNCFLDESKVK